MTDRTFERPGVYFHVEFGVSWSPRRPCKNRQVTYMSRSLRDREQQFPRQLPPANTNYLTNNPAAHSVDQFNLHQLHLQQYPYQHYYYNPQLPRNRPEQSPRTDSPRSRRQGRPPSPRTPVQASPNSNEGRRSSRSASRRPSHGRGKSAPPPLNDSPWDDEPEPMAASALPIPKHKAMPLREPELRRTLTDVPSLPSLGLDSPPGIAWALPTGFIAGMEDNTDIPYEQHSRARSNTAPRNRDDRDARHVREMGSLAEALMTVDNGFEDQWWYQGPRLVNISGEMRFPSSAGHRGSVVSDSDCVYSPVEQYMDYDTIPQPLQPVSPPSTFTELVSPLSQTASPGSGYPALTRSLTTRSDELHM
ncbi:hypothetical protein B0I35DRAFT_191614 [Stachybotrys elegans]|uniref:Uncharacterized protein n=1 Tax=Stachybotrys elegans TaxID=80388 RepID=A0A8K0SW36_9HYPO|nr:hypothetical protein B0I35DRAFT_191614 [Stachybotrys elegans]